MSHDRLCLGMEKLSLYGTKRSAEATGEPPLEERPRGKRSCRTISSTGRRVIDTGVTLLITVYSSDY